MSAFFKILKNNTNIKIPFSSTPHPEPNIMELGTLHGDPWYPSNFHLPIQRLIDFDSSNFMAIADDIVQPNNQKLVKIMAYGVAAFTVLSTTVDLCMKVLF
jgi:hypothetical protein